MTRMLRRFAAFVFLTLPAWPRHLSFRRDLGWRKVWKDACFITVDAGLIQERWAHAAVYLIDLSRYTAIPGLIDVHTHMTYVLENRVSQAVPTWGRW